MRISDDRKTQITSTGLTDESPMVKEHKQGELLYALSKEKRESWKTLVGKSTDTRNDTFSFSKAEASYKKLKDE